MLMILVGLTLVTYPLVLMVAPPPPIFSKNVIYAVLYIWSKRNPTGQANIWGIPIAAMYLPFAYLALTVFMGGAYMDMIHGMATGHVYYFLADVLPQVQGRDFLQTPQFLVDYFGIGEYQAPVAPRPQQQPQQQQAPRTGGLGGGQAPNATVGGGGGGGGHNWGGGGRALGRE